MRRFVEAHVARAVVDDRDERLVAAVDLAMQQPERSVLSPSSQVMKIAPWWRKPRDAMTRGIHFWSHSSPTEIALECMLCASLGTTKLSAGGMCQARAGTPGTGGCGRAAAASW